MTRYRPGDPNLPDVGDRVTITAELEAAASDAKGSTAAGTPGEVIGMGWLPDGEPGYSVELLDEHDAKTGVTVFARASALRKTSS